MSGDNWRSTRSFGKCDGILRCFCRRDSNLVKEEIRAFLNNRRISQAIVGQVTGNLHACA